MLYLQENPLLREPLKPEHIKNRLLGHWGSSPGLAFTYIHLMRQIKKYDQDMIFLAGPGMAPPVFLLPSIWKAATPRCTRTSVKTKKACGNFSSNSRFPEASGATAPRRRRARFTKEESLGMCYRTLAGRRSIIRN